jgi:hypothetical protein
LPSLVDVLRGRMTLFGPPPRTAYALRLTPGLIDWRIAFEDAESLRTPRDHMRDAEYAVLWTLGRVLKACALSVWYVLRRP